MEDNEDLMTTPKSISLGIIGLGSFGSSFVDLFAAHPLVSRIALCDREADRVATMAKRLARPIQACRERLLHFL